MQTQVDLPNYNKICDILRSYNVSYASLFGSRAYGDNKSNSDYDIVVDFASNSNITLLGMIKLKQSLEDILHQKIDLITRKNLSPYLRDSILSSVKPFYEQKN